MCNFRTPEFMPFVVFVTNEEEMASEKSDSRTMYEDYRYFDATITKPIYFTAFSLLNLAIISLFLCNLLRYFSVAVRKILFIYFECFRF